MGTTLLTGGISAFAQRVAKLFPNDNLVFADSFPIPSVFIQSGKYIAIPAPSSSSFVHELLKICLDHHITQLLPLRKEELLPLAESKILFEEYNLRVLLPPANLLREIPMILDPTLNNSPKVVVNGMGDHADLDTPMGVYALDGTDQFKLCCIL